MTVQRRDGIMSGTGAFSSDAYLMTGRISGAIFGAGQKDSEEFAHKNAGEASIKDA